ncbi:hypothetical protein ACOI1H_22990 [Loktanella sp. DJP18]|uniref:hypothetical protein n=1 Tax=Loktanella sp. DJP18 TaxID=3409788 RepID=UPI003BB66B0F
MDEIQKVAHADGEPTLPLIAFYIFVWAVLTAGLIPLSGLIAPAGLSTSLTIVFIAIAAMALTMMTMSLLMTIIGCNGNYLVYPALYTPGVNATHLRFDSPHGYARLIGSVVITIAGSTCLAILLACSAYIAITPLIGMLLAGSGLATALCAKHVVLETLRIQAITRGFDADVKVDDASIRTDIPVKF